MPISPIPPMPHFGQQPHARGKQQPIGIRLVDIARQILPLKQISNNDTVELNGSRLNKTLSYKDLDSLNINTNNSTLDIKTTGKTVFTTVTINGCNNTLQLDLSDCHPRIGTRLIVEGGQNNFNATLSSNNDEITLRSAASGFFDGGFGHDKVQLPYSLSYYEQQEVDGKTIITSKLDPDEQYTLSNVETIQSNNHPLPARLMPQRLKLFETLCQEAGYNDEDIQALLQQFENGDIGMSSDRETLNTLKQFDVFTVNKPLHNHAFERHRQQTGPKHTRQPDPLAFMLSQFQKIDTYDLTDDLKQRAKAYVLFTVFKLGIIPAVIEQCSETTLRMKVNSIKYHDEESGFICYLNDDDLTVDLSNPMNGVEYNRKNSSFKAMKKRSFYTTTNADHDKVIKKLAQQLTDAIHQDTDFKNAILQFKRNYGAAIIGDTLFLEYLAPVQRGIERALKLPEQKLSVLESDFPHSGTYGNGHVKVKRPKTYSEQLEHEVLGTLVHENVHAWHDHQVETAPKDCNDPLIETYRLNNLHTINLQYDNALFRELLDPYYREQPIEYETFGVESKMKPLLKTLS